MSVDIQHLTPRQLAAQCIMPRLVPNDYANNETIRNEVHSLIKEGIGGFCVFQGEAESTARLLDSLQAESTIPLLFSADYEHGLPMRLEGGTDFPHAMALAQAGNPEQTFKAAATIALEAKAIGIHWNFAPVCDINSHTANPIINIRAFAEYPLHAEAHLQAFIKGTQSQNVLACAKHFPGHGNTETDSHSALPTIDAALDELLNKELVPFRKAIEAGVQSIMIGHLAVPALDPTLTPASLSYEIMHNVLRKEWNYQGLIITDALDMHAISKTYSSAEASIACLQAGATIALVPDNATEALQAIAKKAEEDEQFLQVLRDNVIRILNAKSWCGLDKKPDLMPALDSKTMEDHAMLALDIAKSALRIYDPEKLLPFQDSVSFAAFAVLGDDNQSTIDKGVAFFRVLAQTLENECDFGFINADISDADALELQSSVNDVDCIILALLMRPQSYKGTIGINPQLQKALTTISNNKPVIAMLLGSPYLHEVVPANAYVTAYSDSLPSLAAAALTVSGRTTAKPWTQFDAGAFKGESA